MRSRKSTEKDRLRKSNFTITGRKTEWQVLEDGTGTIDVGGVLDVTGVAAIVASGDAILRVDGTARITGELGNVINSSGQLNLRVGETGILETVGTNAVAILEAVSGNSAI